MASPVLKSEVLADIRSRGEFREGYVNDTVLGRWMDQSYAALWDIIIDGDPNRLPLSSSTISVVSGTDTYALPSDYYHMMRVDYVDGDRYYRLEPFVLGDQNELIESDSDPFLTKYTIKGGSILLSQEPSWTGTLRVYYIPVSPGFSDDPSTTESHNMWTEWVILDCLIKLGMAEDSDAVSAWQTERAIVEKRIMRSSRADRSSPRQLHNSRTIVADGRALYSIRRRR
ncbi:MAG: hypothetical protein QNJ16_18815 [Rhodobacter sp.]|nr:hypothetical protein [Rhodobacter sp.]